MSSYLELVEKYDVDVVGGAVFKNLKWHYSPSVYFHFIHEIGPYWKKVSQILNEYKYMVYLRIEEGTDFFERILMTESYKMVKENDVYIIYHIQMRRKYKV